MSQTSEGNSRSSLENGGRERDRGSESDEDEESEQNISDTGRSEYSSVLPVTLTHELPLSAQVSVCVTCLQVLAGRQISGILEGLQHPKAQQGGRARLVMQQSHAKVAGLTSLSSSLSLGETQTRQNSPDWKDLVADWRALRRAGRTFHL